MFMFGGWDYSSVLAMVDDLVYGRRYGGFFDIINNLTVRELMEIFTIIQNKENEKNLQSAMAQGGNDVSVPTKEMSEEMFNLLMDI